MYYCFQVFSPENRHFSSQAMFWQGTCRGTLIGIVRNPQDGFFFASYPFLPKIHIRKKIVCGRRALRTSFCPLAPATPRGWLYEPETPSESSMILAWRGYNLEHDMARQLRPFLHWSVPARPLAWLRYWRLCGWWRALS